MQRAIVGGFFGLFLFSSSAMATICSSYPYTFTNGTTADASQVMADLNCAALTSGATINGATLNSAAAIGIGTSPASGYSLDISAGSNIGLRITGAGGYLALNSTAPGFTSLFGQNSGTNEWSIGTSGGGTTNYIQFQVNTGSGLVEAGRFGNDASFLVGTTTNGGWLGNAKLEAKVGTGQALSGWVATSGGNALVARVDTTGSNFAYFVYGAGTPTNVGSITTNGTSTAYNTTSDERLKNWSITQQNYEQTIRQLWIGDFQWKANGRADFGIRAQQAYRLFPAAIHKPANSKGHWEADYSKLAPLALWGVKDIYRTLDKQIAVSEEQHADVEGMKEKLASQSAEIATLEKHLASLEQHLDGKLARN